MRLAQFFHDLSTLVVRLERVRGRAIHAPRVCEAVHDVLELVIEHAERERGIDWYRPETWPKNQEALN